MCLDVGMTNQAEENKIEAETEIRSYERAAKELFYALNFGTDDAREEAIDELHEGFLVSLERGGWCPDCAAADIDPDDWSCDAFRHADDCRCDEIEDYDNSDPICHACQTAQISELFTGESCRQGWVRAIFCTGGPHYEITWPKGKPADALFVSLPWYGRHEIPTDHTNTPTLQLVAEYFDEIAPALVSWVR